MKAPHPVLILVPLLLGGCVYIDTTAPVPPAQVYYYPAAPPPPGPPPVQGGYPATPGEPIPLPPPR